MDALISKAGLPLDPIQGGVFLYLVVDGLAVLVGDVAVEDLDRVLREELLDLQQIALLLRHAQFNSIINHGASRGNT